MKKQIKTYLSKELKEMLIGYFNGEKNDKQTLDNIVDGIVDIVNKNKEIQIDIKD